MRRPAFAWLLLVCGMIAWAGCNRKHQGSDFLPSAPGFSGALVVSVSATSIPADGFSRVEIAAQITGEADLDKRQVRFTTDNGDFPGVNGASLGQSRDVEVTSAGVALIELRSSTSPALATITARVLKKNDDGTVEVIEGLVTRITVEFTPPDAEAIIQLSTSEPRGEADGSSVIFVHADVGGGIPLANRPVTFVTTLGTFVGGTAGGAAGTHTVTITADIDRRATATLTSPTTAGEALVTASVANTTGEIRISFDPALPEDILVNLGAVKLERGGLEETTITVILSRAEGMVSDGLAIDYSAFEKAYGEPLDLIFRDQELSDGEMAMAKVALGTVSFVGTATIRAQVGNVRGEADIEIDAPGPAPDITVNPENLAFGSVAMGATKDLAITIGNAGDDDLIVSGLHVAGGDFSIPALPSLPTVIAPGGSFGVTIRFSPAAVGAQSGTLRITSNDPNKGQLSVALTGEGT